MVATYFLSLLVLFLLPCVVIGATVSGVGVACVYNTDTCSSVGTICDVTGKCLYKAGVVCAEGTSKCMSGATCQSISSQCTCNPAAYDVSNSICVAKANKVGGTCTTSCDDTHATCTGTTGSKKCTCNNAYTVQYSDATCVVTPNTYGGACTAPTGGTDSCVANDANSKCSGTSGTCGCKTYYSGSIGATCVVTPNTYGGACTAPVGGTDSCVANDANSKCSGTSGTCGCKTNYSGSIGTKCAEDNKYGGACTAPVGGIDSCVANDANSECSGATGKCGCKTGFTGSIGTLCSGAIELTGSLFLLFGVLLLKTNLL